VDYKPLQYLYQPAARPGLPTLLLLHGTGGDERDLLPLAKNFGPDLNLLSVRGNVLESGMPRFFKRLGMGVFDEQDLRFRTHELVHFLRELAPREGFDPEQLWALGYSNGANIAGGVLMLYPEFLAGAMLFRPMQPLADEPVFPTSRKQAVFFSSGKHDPTVDPAATDRYSKLLESNGFRVSRHDLEAGHQLTQQDVRLAVQWYQSQADRLMS